MSKMICENFGCEWAGDEADEIHATCPYKIRYGSVVCPNCGCVTLAAACDEPGCDKPATCGTPAPGGYRRTCLAHRPTQKGSE
jgi:hypothetical protein